MYEFRPAVRTKTSTLTAFAGPTGCGKTMTALRYGRGLAGPGGKIAVADSEGGRALHYADQFQFDHCELVAPFRPDTYMDAVDAAEKAGYDVIIIDSMSHEFEGPGGIQEWADELEASGTKSPGNWKVPKTAHRRMMNRLVQCRAHLIFCLRADEKMLLKQEPQFNPDGSPKMWNGKQSTKTVVVPAEQRPLLERWQPICEKRFMYEMTASFLLLPTNPGVGIPIKLQDQHRPFFPEGEKIGESSGAAMAAWSHGKPAAGNQPDSRPAATSPAAWVDAYKAKIAAAADVTELAALQEKAAAAIAKLKANEPELYADVIDANSARFTELTAEVATEGVGDE